MCVDTGVCNQVLLANKCGPNWEAHLMEWYLIEWLRCICRSYLTPLRLSFDLFSGAGTILDEVGYHHAFLTSHAFNFGDTQTEKRLLKFAIEDIFSVMEFIIVHLITYSALEWTSTVPKLLDESLCLLRVGTHQQFFWAVEYFLVADYSM